MYLVLYDIEDDRLRTRFSKFLQKYGRRLQYSVFEVKNSKRILDNIKTEIKTNFSKKFGQAAQERSSSRMWGVNKALVLIHEKSPVKISFTGD